MCWEGAPFHWFCGGSTINELREVLSSSSLVTSSFWSWALVVCVVCSCVVGWVVVVVLVEVVGRAFELVFRCGKAGHVARK